MCDVQEPRSYLFESEKDENIELVKEKRTPSVWRIHLLATCWISADFLPSTGWCLFLSLTIVSGESANAVPHYQKLCSRDSRIWGIRRGQHSRSAMAEPRPGWTTFMIMVSPLPGKYELYTFRVVTRPQETHFKETVPTHLQFKETLFS